MERKVTFPIVFLPLIFIASVKTTLPGVVPGGDIEGRLTKVDKCSDHKHTFISYEDVSINKVSKDKYVLNAKIAVHNKTQGKIKISTKIIKCKEIDKPDTCETFTELITQDACDDLKKGRGQIKAMFEKAHVDIKSCPISPAHYTISKYELTMSDKAKTFAAISYYWKGRSIAEATHDGKTVVIFCIDFEATLGPKEKGRQRKFSG